MKPPICRVCGIGHWGIGHIWPKSSGGSPAVLDAVKVEEVEVARPKLSARPRLEVAREAEAAVRLKGGLRRVSRKAEAVVAEVRLLAGPVVVPEAVSPVSPEVSSEGASVSPEPVVFADVASGVFVSDRAKARAAYMAEYMRNVRLAKKRLREASRGLSGGESSEGDG